jgi:twitching motility protein PilU
MAAAIAYAQSGHLCLATLHANNSYHAMNRIIGFYPLENRPALLGDLSAALKSIISQRLVKSVSGGRRPAVEVLLNTRHISELINKGEINAIKEAMDASLSAGTQTFEQALYRLMIAGEITQEEALANSDSPTNLMYLINNAPAPGPAAKPEAEASQKDSDNGASFTEFTLNA